tara:strand:- start:5152 stop:6306 length:1155 start_codon:yes stop_codon:yes gene_type:complete
MADWTQNLSEMGKLSNPPAAGLAHVGNKIGNFFSGDKADKTDKAEEESAFEKITGGTEDFLDGIVDIYDELSSKTGTSAFGAFDTSSESARDPVYDVINKANWSLATKEMKQRTPRVYCRQFKMNTNGLLSSLIYYVAEGIDISNELKNVDIKKTLKGGVKISEGADPKTSETGGLKPYQSMYPRTNEEKDWIFPYFGDSHTDYSSEWAAVELPGGKKVAEWAAKLKYGLVAADVIKEAAESIGEGKGIEGTLDQGFAFDQIKAFNYSGSGGGTFNVSFPLYNTIEEGDINHNLKIITELLKAAKPTKTSAFTVEPPRLFDLLVPGIRYIPFAYISKINIKKHGKSIFKAEGMLNVPEAYTISIDFTSLVPDTANFLSPPKVTT